MNLNISICLSDLPKEKMVQAKNGKVYISLDAYVKDEKDQYGNDVAVSVSRTKEEREAQEPRVYVGNGRKFEYDNGNRPADPTAVSNLPFNTGGLPPVPPTTTATGDESDDLPF